MAGSGRITVERLIVRARMSQQPDSPPELYPSLLVLRVNPVPRTPFVLDISRLPVVPERILLHDFPNGPWSETIWYGKITQRELNQALESIVDVL
ncbi:ORF0 [Fowl aviadenovirus D]|uniref:ORF0 n=2 Tax=Fowl aviadenovirus D TaxID=190064 RepID=A0A1B1CUT1_9ADEN|nr:ORF0 [Fowl aviadenovirus 2]ANP93622.1 ORF0 [Fowl aviadenovirus D]ATG30751.1 ORF0 [Fowl aviadenovirus D]WIM48595.1 ORF0 [Fowl aviadenovirus D]